MKPELLSPAGDLQSGYAALYYGADAVYLGLEHFSARATAENFTKDTLSHFTGYAHSLGRKVFVAINTIIKQEELPLLQETLAVCTFCQVDGVIIQDLGVARIIKESYPNLEMHASTQMAIHNKEGALALQALGFKRVVLARELSLSAIKEIAQIPNLETEAFIHGALCYSYSGLCLFSSLTFAKSANRGKCLYPCRSCFTDIKGESKHYFSMKDMALGEDILKMPVTSLKIEGRKKNALYVAAVTDYYRHILDTGHASIAKEENIKQIFSRPWTKFNLLEKNKDVVDKDFVGHRGLLIGKVESILKDKLQFTTSHIIGRHDGIQIEIKGEEKPFGFSAKEIFVNGKSVFEAPAGKKVTVTLPKDKPFISVGSPVFLASSGTVKSAYDYQKPNPKDYQIRKAIPITVTVSANEITASTTTYKSTISEAFSPAKDPSKTLAAIQESFAKSKDTEFNASPLTVNNPNNLFVPKSLLNELRRNLFSQIVITEELPPLPPTDKPVLHNFKGFIVKTDDLKSVSLLNQTDIYEVIYQIEPTSDIKGLTAIPKNKIRIALPPVCKNPQSYKTVISTLLAQGYKKWEIGNYWGLKALPPFGIDLTFAEQIYTLNTQSIQMAKEQKAGRITLPVEGSLETLKSLATISQLPVCQILYQDTPLFISNVCIKDNPCKTCDKKDMWQTLSEQSGKYNALSHNCQTFVFAKEATYIAPEGKEIPADFFRIDFMYKVYTPEQALEIFTKATSFAEIKSTRKANLFKEI